MVFLPIGDKARWRIIYDLLVQTPVGEILTYAEMAEALELDEKSDRQIIQMSARRAMAELLDKDRRTCRVERNLGYQVVQPSEHLVLAEDRERRARTQIQLGYDVATKVDLSLVDPNVRDALTTLAMGFAQQMEINRRIDRRQRRQGDAIALLKKQVSELQELVHRDENHEG